MRWETVWIMLVFSADGNSLAAGGANRLDKDGHWWHQIRVWNQAGKGSYTDYNGGANTIMDIKALPNGTFVFGSSQPDWGIISPAAGQRSRYVGSDINAYYTAEDISHFRFGSGGEEVGITPSPNQPCASSCPVAAFRKPALLRPLPAPSATA